MSEIVMTIDEYEAWRQVKNATRLEQAQRILELERANADLRAQLEAARTALEVVATMYSMNEKLTVHTSDCGKCRAFYYHCDMRDALTNDLAIYRIDHDGEAQVALALAVQ